METLKPIEEIVTELDGLFVKRKVNVKTRKGLIKTSLKNAYNQNMLVQCSFPEDKYLRAQRAFISACGNVFPDEEHYNVFSE